MKEYFDLELVKKAKRHAAEEFPKESCGFFVKNEYIRMKNKSDTPESDFLIDTEEFIKYDEDIDCIVHSHNNYAHASKKDMQQQEVTAKPWGIINVVEGTPREVVFFGDQLEPQDLIGRPFFHGVYDCYSLVRDYYNVKRNIKLKNLARENFWWETEPSLLENNFEPIGFKKIPLEEVREGDGVFMKIRANVVNHSGVVLDKGLVLHHMYNALSRREPIGIYNKYISGYLRYVGC